MRSEKDLDVRFVPVSTDDDRRRLAGLAAEIWNEYWPALIGQAQTDYMVESFQSLPAIERDMSEHGYEYWFLEVPAADGGFATAGYTGGHEEPQSSRFFISKIYLLKEFRGCGLARRTVAFYDELCKSRSLGAMYLTVNKHNELGVRAYKGTGFSVIDAVETDIGSGFVMDDFVMERPVAREP